MASENEVLAQLDHIDAMLDRLERAQNTANYNLSTKIETQLTRSVADLYTRHGREPPASTRRADVRRHTSR